MNRFRRTGMKKETAPGTVGTVPRIGRLTQLRSHGGDRTRRSHPLKASRTIDRVAVARNKRNGCRLATLGARYLGLDPFLQTQPGFAI